MKNTSKKLLALLLACMTLISLASCGNGGTTGAAPSAAPSSASASVPASAAPSSAAPSSAAPDASTKDTLNVAVALDPGTLDPMGITGNGGFMNIAYAYMEPLLQTMKGRERVWILATGIDKVTDTQYTMHLREDVTFSNGNPFTAEDVLFTFNLYSQEPSRKLNVQSLDLPNCKVIDEHTVDLRYIKFNAAQEIMLGSVLIVDAESFDAKTMSTNPVGTGPYLVTDYVVNSHVTLKTRDDYWGDKPAIKNLNCLVLNESSQVTNALETGMVDVARVPVADVEHIKSLGNFVIETDALGRANAVFYNMSDGAPLAQKEARYAISYAIDSQAIIDLAYNGYGELTDWPGSRRLIDYEPRFANLHDTYADPHNLEKAKQYAEQSGLVGKTLTFITNGAEDYVTAAQIIQSDLKTIGINVEVKNYDQASFYGLISDVSNFDIALYAASAPTTMAADIFASYPMFFTCGWTGPEREAYMELGRETLATADATQRGEKLLELTKILEDFSPWYAIGENQVLTAYSKDIQGINCTINGMVFFSKLSFAS